MAAQLDKACTLDKLRLENQALRDEVNKLQQKLITLTHHNPITTPSHPPLTCGHFSASALGSVTDEQLAHLPVTASKQPSHGDRAHTTHHQQQQQQQKRQQQQRQQQRFTASHSLAKGQVERYSRQLLLPSFGTDAQAKLCSSSVLIVGCGGLGAPAALYLTAAGVGRLGLVDHDTVELSNLHRQVIHSEHKVGMHKADSAAVACAALNSTVDMQVHRGGFNPSNAVQLVSQYDVVIDATDNPPTRYLISDACVVCHKPLVSAAAVGTDGQLTVYCAGPEAPCYRCLFPDSPAPENCSRCSEAGVLGPVPGVMGLLQALEAVKICSGIGKPLVRQLLLFDGLSARFTTVKLRGPVAGCIACGQDAIITREAIASYNYEAFTGQRADDGPPKSMKVLPPEQRIAAQALDQVLDQALDQVLGSTDIIVLDVRPKEQFAVMSLPGAVNVPFDNLEQRLPEILQMCEDSRQRCEPGNTVTQQHSHANTHGQHQNVLCGEMADSRGPAAGKCNVSNEGCTVESGHGTKGASVPSVYVVCRRGNDSQLAVERLRQAGIYTAVDVVGGMQAWAKEVDSDMPLL
eukprot:jgi/Chrzof1/5706/Cz16g12150.t1